MKTKTIYLVALVRDDIGGDALDRLANFIANAFSSYKGEALSTVPVLGISAQDTPFTEEDVEASTAVLLDSWKNMSQGVIDGVDFLSRDDFNHFLNREE